MVKNKQKKKTFAADGAGGINTGDNYAFETFTKEVSGVVLLLNSNVLGFPVNEHSNDKFIKYG